MPSLFDRGFKGRWDMSASMLQSLVKFAVFWREKSITIKALRNCETNQYRNPTTLVFPTLPCTPIYQLIAFPQLACQNSLSWSLWGEILLIQGFEYSASGGNEYTIKKSDQWNYLAKNNIESLTKFFFTSRINIFLVGPFLVFRILIIKLPSSFYPIDNPRDPRCHEMVDEERDSTVRDGLVASKFKSLFDKKPLVEQCVHIIFRAKNIQPIQTRRMS